MADFVPYLGYELTGPKKITELLETHGISCTLFEDESVHRLFESHADVLRADRDSLRIGCFRKDEVILFFAEFALRIHDDMTSHISFLFDHHPVLEDLQGCADDMEGIVLTILKKMHDEKGGLA